MIWPESNEQRRLSEVLLALYGADDVADFRERALNAVHRVFGGELACHNEINLANGESLSALSRPIDDFPQLRPAFFEHVEQHPSVQHHLAAEGCEKRAVKTSDFVSQRRWRGCGLYSDFYRPLADVRYQLTIGQKIEDTLIFLAISRRHRDFTERERSMLTMLRPHFIQAYHNASFRSKFGALASERTNGQPLESAASAFALMQRFALSRREAEALVELARGDTNAEVAHALGISVSTLKTRLERLYRKLGVRSRTAAVARVFEEAAGN